VIALADEDDNTIDSSMMCIKNTAHSCFVVTGVEYNTVTITCLLYS